MRNNQELLDFIRQGWIKCLVDKKEFESDDLPTVAPFTPPCINGHFKTLFYWDTYFTDIGLLIDNYYQLAKDNLLNFVHYIEQYGYIPNFAKKGGLICSQPPFFSQMLYEYYSYTQDNWCLNAGVTALEKEYIYFTTKNHRKVKNSLLRYGHNEEYINDYTMPGHINYYADRLKKDKKEVTKEFVLSKLAEGEGGWDTTPRFYNRGLDYAPIDLNCLVYLMEKNLAYFYGIKGDVQNQKYYTDLAEIRRRDIVSLCKDDDGIYYDYNSKQDKKSDYITSASFYPYYAGIEKSDDGVDKLLKELEYPFGLSSVQNRDNKEVMQWDFPNLWPPLVLIAVRGLINVNRKADARRIAVKYMDVVENEYKRTSALWEKYDVTDGKKASHHEYFETQMLGWTAGVYLDCYRLFGKD